MSRRASPGGDDGGPRAPRFTARRALPGLGLDRTIYVRKRRAFEVMWKESRIRFVLMNEMPASNDQPPPTMRSPEGSSVPMRRSRPVPVVAVVAAPAPAWSGWPPPPAPSTSLLSEVAREVATSLLDLALGAARARWS